MTVWLHVNTYTMNTCTIRPHLTSSTGSWKLQLQVEGHRTKPVLPPANWYEEEFRSCGVFLVACSETLPSVGPLTTSHKYCSCLFGCLDPPQIRVFKMAETLSSLHLYFHHPYSAHHIVSVEWLGMKVSFWHVGPLRTLGKDNLRRCWLFKADTQVVVLGWS